MCFLVLPFRLYDAKQAKNVPACSKITWIVNIHRGLISIKELFFYYHSKTVATKVNGPEDDLRDISRYMFMK